MCILTKVTEKCNKRIKRYERNLLVFFFLVDELVLTDLFGCEMFLCNTAVQVLELGATGNS